MIHAVSGPFSSFPLACSYPEVKEKQLFEVFKTKNWNHPIVEMMLKNPHVYTKWSYYMAYLSIKLEKQIFLFEKEKTEMRSMLDILVKMSSFYVVLALNCNPECFKVLALAGEIVSPLHQVNNFLAIENQAEVVEFLLQQGFDPNEFATCPFIYKHHLGYIDFEVSEYTPIYFANYLTAPILIKYGAKIDANIDYTLEDEILDQEIIQHHSNAENEQKELLLKFRLWFNGL